MMKYREVCVARSEIFSLSKDWRVCLACLASDVNRREIYLDIVGFQPQQTQER